MLVLITYDVSVVSDGGQRRLRNIAKTCLDYGMRPAQFVVLKSKLMDIFNPEEDSIRFYMLGKKGRQKVEHIGAKPAVEPLTDALIL